MDRADSVYAVKCKLGKGKRFSLFARLIKERQEIMKREAKCRLHKKILIEYE